MTPQIRWNFGAAAPQVCGAVDLIEALGVVIKAEGAVVQTQSTRKAHPCIKEQTMLRGFVVRSLQTLGLGVEALKPGPGHPTRPSGWRPDD
jgi:hypothetical protein